MNPKVQPWLPRDAIAPERIRRALEQLAGEWSGFWFAGARPFLSPTSLEDWPSDGSASWRSSDGVMSIELGGQARPTIAGAMLSTNVPSSLDGPDRIVVEELARAALDDLLVRVTRFVHGGRAKEQLSSEPIDFADCYWWTVAFVPGKRAFKFALSRAASIAIVKQSLLPVEPPRLVETSEALSGKEITLSASIGRCSISFCDLKDLAAGDVLVLDRAVDRPVDLLVDGRASALRGSLEAKRGKATLLLS